MSAVIHLVMIIFIFSVILSGFCADKKPKNLPISPYENLLDSSILPIIEFDYNQLFSIKKWYYRYYEAQDEFEHHKNNKCGEEEIIVDSIKPENFTWVRKFTSTQTGKVNEEVYEGFYSPETKIMYAEPLDSEVNWRHSKSWGILINPINPRKRKAWYVVLYHTAVNKNNPAHMLEKIIISTSDRHVKINLNEIQKLLQSNGIIVRFSRELNNDCNEE